MYSFYQAQILRHHLDSFLGSEYEVRYTMNHRENDIGVIVRAKAQHATVRYAGAWPEVLVPELAIGAKVTVDLDSDHRLMYFIEEASDDECRFVMPLKKVPTALLAFLG